MRRRRDYWLAYRKRTELRLFRRRRVLLNNLGKYNDWFLLLLTCEEKG